MSISVLGLNNRYKPIQRIQSNDKSSPPLPPSPPAACHPIEIDITPLNHKRRTVKIGLRLR